MSVNTDAPDNSIADKVLDAAERLFTTRGYAAVRMRDIAEAVGVKHPALYYHFSDGKEQIYVAMMTRRFARVRDGINTAVANAQPSFEGQIQATIEWLSKERLPNFTRMVDADIPELSAEHGRYLVALAFETLNPPIRVIFERFQSVITVSDPIAAAFVILSLGQIIHDINYSLQGSVEERQRLATLTVEMVLYGLLKR